MLWKDCTPSAYRCLNPSPFPRPFEISFATLGKKVLSSKGFFFYQFHPLSPEFLSPFSIRQSSFYEAMMSASGGLCTSLSNFFRG
jgi:hypothetical protein